MERRSVFSVILRFLWLIIRKLLLYIEQNYLIDSSDGIDYYNVCFCLLFHLENIRRVPSNSSMSSVSGSSMTVLQTTNEHEKQDFDTVSIESYGLSPLALQNIREQMALSLERTKHLEDQVKLIPELKVSKSIFTILIASSLMNVVCEVFFMVHG